MSFHEIRLDVRISYGSTTTHEYKTSIVEVPSGDEFRKGYWSKGRRKWNVNKELLTRADVAILESFYRGRKGRLYGFRMRDWSSYKILDEPLPLIDTHHAQLQFVYGDPLNPEVQIIKKPVLEADVNNDQTSSSYSPDITLKRDGVAFPRNRSIIAAYALVSAIVIARWAPNVVNYSTMYDETTAFTDNSVDDYATVAGDSSFPYNTNSFFYHLTEQTTIDEIRVTAGTSNSGDKTATLAWSNDGNTWTNFQTFTVNNIYTPSHHFTGLNLFAAYVRLTVPDGGTVGDFRLYKEGTQYTPGIDYYVPQNPYQFAEHFFIEPSTCFIASGSTITWEGGATCDLTEDIEIGGTEVHCTSLTEEVAEGEVGHATNQWGMNRTTGVITLVDVQTGHDITWSGSWDYPARFLSDEAAFHRESLDIHDWSGIDILELKS